MSSQLEELVSRNPDNSPRRGSEPYRQAIVGIYARLVATARGFGQNVLPRHEVAETTPYASSAELRNDLDILYRSLVSNGSAMIARRPACACCGARSKSSASISPASTSARTPTCMSG